MLFFNAYVRLPIVNQARSALLAYPTLLAGSLYLAEHAGLIPFGHSIKISRGLGQFWVKGSSIVIIVPWLILELIVICP